MDTIQPDDDILAAMESNVLGFSSGDVRNTPAHIMRRLFGASQAGDFESMLVLARKSDTKVLVIAASDDLNAGHLAVLAQVVDSLAKASLGLASQNLNPVKDGA